ncbi:MAG: NAD(P)-dependent oxidoreductase [Gammaproteobacteria bacterium]|nr:NAD(P)-dependent oxidoreductase [Gammaproteobacteria bacterium]
MAHSPASDHPATERIGFIGLGNMGGPMARNLLEAGFELTVLDLDAERVAALATRGARVASSPRELAEHSDVVCSVVMNDRQTREVMLGDDGVLAGAAAGTLVILHSTLSVATCQELGRLAAARGVDLIDAAVSGAAERSEQGSLTLMVGGEAAVLERARPVFEVVGERVFHMGPLGMGQAAKQCNNLMSLVNVHVVEEALRLASALGIEEARMRELAECSSGDSWSLRNIDNMRALAALHTGGDTSMGRFGRKDISLASKLAASIGTPTPIVDFVFDLTKQH